MKKKEREFVEVDEVAIKRMIAGDMPPYLEKEEKMLPPAENKNEPAPDNGAVAKEGKEEDADNPKASRKRKVAKDSYRETFLLQPRTAGCRQSTLNLDEKNHAAIKKVLKAADGLSMAGFVNNVLSHHFREYGQEITGIMRSYMSDLYKEEEL